MVAEVQQEVPRHFFEGGRNVYIQMYIMLCEYYVNNILYVCPQLRRTVSNHYITTKLNVLEMTIL